MKKLTAAIAALALYFSASALGTEPGNDLNALLNPSNAKVIKSEKVGKVILSAFDQQFSNATEVSWKENQGLYFGYFKQKDQNIMVAYTPEGELYAVARKVLLSELPVGIKDKLKEKYSDCAITDNVSAIQMEGTTSYYVSVENKTSVKLVQFYSEGQDNVVKKTKKKVLVGSVM